MVATLTTSLYRVAGVSKTIGFVAFSSAGVLGEGNLARACRGFADS
jgi:hypothetical protein